MMGRTHVACGVAAALLALRPDTPAGCLRAVLAGAVGGVVCDLDASTPRTRRDARSARLIAAALTVTVLACDRVISAGLWDSLLEHAGLPAAFGAAGFLAVCLLGIFSGHRSFMHSLAACALLSGALWLAWPAAAPMFAAGFLSHLALDLTNHRPIRLLYPLKKGACLGWFRADGLADRLFLLAGTIASVAGFWLCLL